MGNVPVGSCVPQQDIVSGNVGLSPGPALAARRLGADAVAEHADAPGLVEGYPRVHGVVKQVEAAPGVGLEPLGGVAAEPASLGGQGGREVPVVQGRQRLDPIVVEKPQELAVELDA